MTAICAHGYFEWRCGICSHLPGECDYGSCHAPATAVAVYVRPDRAHRSVTVERRPMCSHHAAISAQIAGCKVVVS